LEDKHFVSVFLYYRMQVTQSEVFFCDICFDLQVCKHGFVDDSNGFQISKL
ncbi:3619_t:CDS:2, partial [Dentiscutata erythropus]